MTASWISGLKAIFLFMLTPMMILILVGYLASDRVLSSTIIAVSSLILWILVAAATLRLARPTSGRLSTSICLVWSAIVAPAALFLAGQHFFVTDASSSATLPVAATVGSSLLGFVVTLVVWINCRALARGRDNTARHRDA